jgi:hypothetical protein
MFFFQTIIASSASQGLSLDPNSSGNIHRGLLHALKPLMDRHGMRLMSSRGPARFQTLVGQFCVYFPSFISEVYTIGRALSNV